MAFPLHFNSRDPASIQLEKYSKHHEDTKHSITTNSGIPVGVKTASETVGYYGPTLLQDWVLLEELAHFSRERIPERVVHAKGAGAFGYFEVTHDITQYSAAVVFSEIGKRTNIAVRFSQVAGERGYPDTYRDIRGFALKFYTEDGNWDLVGNNSPIFFIRDAVMFPSFIHTLKRNPVTNIRPDYDAFWDFISLRPETIHQTLQMFTDRGIPANYRKMHGFGTNTFSLINKNGQLVYCKFHYLSDQGVANLTQQDADSLAGSQPDFHVKDLYNAIESGNYPSWTFYIQVMTQQEAAVSPFNPFDDTKVWFHKDYPLIPVGRFVLNQNPSNYFAEVEQIAFNVANVIPGIGFSPDRMLQGRTFNYADTHRYRLGVNNTQLPVNAPLSVVHNFTRDGKSTLKSQNGAPNFYPNSFNGPENDQRAKSLYSSMYLSAHTDRLDSTNSVDKEDNYFQAALLWRKVLKEDEKQRTINNMLMWLKQTSNSIVDRVIQQFEKVDMEIAIRLRQGLELNAQTKFEL